MRGPGEVQQIQWPLPICHLTSLLVQGSQLCSSDCLPWLGLDIFSIRKRYSFGVVVGPYRIEVSFADYASSTTSGGTRLCGIATAIALC